MELLKKGSHTDVYFSGSGDSRILKVARGDSSNAMSIRRLEKELEYCNDVESPGMRKAYEKVLVDDRKAISFEYIAGYTWREQLASGPWKIETFLTWAVRAAQSLKNIHEAGLLHLEISPDHLINNEGSETVVFVGFGGAVRRSDQEQIVEHEGSNFQEDLLAYTAPEQTGRTHHHIDVTTDLYSIGAVFYQMVTGTPLFNMEDPLEIIHAHIAKAPIPPDQIRTDLPSAISKLILKLLEKNPDGRYASAEELHAELLDYHEQWQAKGRIEGQGHQDHTGAVRAKVPGPLFAREREVVRLQEIYDAVIDGAVKFTMVSGPSGVSKSSVIRSLRSPVRSSQGLFIEGKFDPYQTDTPYLALVQGLKQLTAFLLTKEQKELDYWKKLISDALGNVGRVLTDIVPDLKYVVGEQPEIPHLEGTEAQNRFFFAFRKFIAAIATKDHPLVMVVDDLQFADIDSINLLESLERDPRISHFLLAATYRQGSLSEDHPVFQKLADWKEISQKITEIQLENLERAEVREFIRETFHADVDNEEELFQKISAKTKGNPLYLELLINALIKDKIILFDTTRNSWLWSVEEFDRLNLSGSTLDLMTARIQHLRAEVQALLSSAACQGNRFHKSVMMQILDLDEDNFDIEISEAIDEGLVIGKNIKEGQVPEHFSFSHEGIRQIAYDRLSDVVKREKHVQIGRFLLGQYSEEQSDESIFDILFQLNQSRELIDSDELRARLAKLNLVAANKGRDSAAFALAHNYIKEGLAFLDDKAWEKHYQLCLDVHNQAVDLAVLIGNHDEMERIAQEISAKAKSTLDLEAVTRSRIHSFIAQKKLDSAIVVARGYLKKVGIKFPEKPGKSHVIRGIIQMQLKLIGKDTDKLAALPPMTNPEVISALRILQDTANAAYFAAPDLLPLVVFKALNLVLKNGMAEESAFGFTSYGFILSGVLGKYKVGFKYGELANKLLEDSKEHEDKYLVARFLHSIFTRHWIEPTYDIVDVMEWSYQKGIELGNFEYSAYGAGSWAHLSFYLGRDLEHMDKKIGEFMDSVEQMNQPTTVPRIGMYRQAIQNLMGKSIEPWIIKGEVYNEEEMIPNHIKDDIGIVCHNIYFLKAFMAYLFEKTDLALTSINESEKYTEAATASYFIPLADYLKALILMQGADAASNMSKVGKLMKKVKKYAELQPENFKHRYTILCAEKARVDGKIARARILYEDAVFLARKGQNLMDEAIAWELGGKFYITLERTGPAGIFIRQAFDLYKKWGATAKTREMEIAYDKYLDLSQSAIADGSSSNIVTAEQIDFLSLVKTLQTLSTEIELSRLLEKIMGIVIENAGAERGLLIIEEGGDWEIIAEKDVNNPVILSDQRRVLSEVDDKGTVPTGIIHYVIRTKESLVLNDVMNHEQFGELPYLETRPAKSMMSLPLIKQNRLIGVIYLENTLSTGAFTPRAQAGLELLSGQLAISLENALLYEGLEQKVKERTREVVKQKAEIEKQAEELVDKNEKLLELGEYKETMTSMIVHDLKNPLNGIVNTVGNSSLEEQNQAMRQSGKIMLNMVMNILDVSKYQESKMALSLNARNLRKLAENSLEQVQFLAQKKMITLNNRVDEGLEVFVDIEVMERVIINLLTNAIKYTPVSGDITIDASPAAEGYVRLSVIDTGEGIKKEDIKLVFQKFGQVNKRKSGGLASTGLGLTFCTLAVEAHGGKMHVDSEYGVGSTFSLTLREGQNSGFVGKTGQDAIKSRDWEVSLGADAKAYIRPFAAKLDGIPVYKVTQFRKILSEADPDYNDDCTVWFNAVDLAMKAGDQQQLEKLLTLVNDD